MANTRLEIEAFARFADAAVWHPITDLNAGRFASPCGIDFAVWDVSSYEVRPAHNSTTITRCSVCENEIRTTVPASVALRG